MKLISLFIFVLFLTSCHKKDSTPVPKPKAIESTIVADSIAEEHAESDSNIHENTDANPSLDTPKAIAFNSKPQTRVYLGQEFQYRPSLNFPESLQIILEKGPDSMRIEKGRLVWSPSQVGQYPVELKVLHNSKSLATSKLAHHIKQGFVLNVTPVLEAILKSLPSQVNKGETVFFDLRSSNYPAWALGDLKVRFDFEGDGQWDTELLPLANNLLHGKTFQSSGHFKPKVEIRYKNSESQVKESLISVISAVSAVLKMSPDTLEPGGVLNLDASNSKGDGRLIYILDINEDGKIDWTDSLAGKGKINAPSSGTYQSVLSVKNSMGQEGKATQPLFVNAKTKLELKIKNPKANMAEEVEVRAHAYDIEDSLVRVRINYTGDTLGWQIRTSKPDSIINYKDWLLRFKYRYGKVGKFFVTLCVLSSDGREVCQKNGVEIFNAAPICKPGADLKATVGKPIDIVGEGVDPDGRIVKWEWDLDNDGKYDLISNKNGEFKYTFAKAGAFVLVLRVTTEDGMIATGNRKVEVRTKW